jgi:hypothetical protein
MHRLLNRGATVQRAFIYSPTNNTNHMSHITGVKTQIIRKQIIFESRMNTVNRWISKGINQHLVEKCLTEQKQLMNEINTLKNSIK